MIIVGVDGSDDGLRAVRFGANTAVRYGGELMLVNAVDDTLMAGAWGVVYDPEVLQAAGVTANEQAKALALELGLDPARLKSEVVMGSPGGVMARLSEVADLVVVGRRAASGLERMFVGSTSVAVVANASCPVVVISAAAHPDPVGSKRVVGVGLQTSPGSEVTLKAGFGQAQRLGSRLEIVHAMQPRSGCSPASSAPPSSTSRSASPRAASRPSPRTSPPGSPTWSTPSTSPRPARSTNSSAAATTTTCWCSAPDRPA
nr:universal stress protein [Tessaracoccus coleopterorum]